RARLAVPATVEGTLTPPWRVILAGPDLDALVTSDAVAALNPPPDPKLFPAGLATPWIRPGRAVWRYLDSPRTPPPPPGRREPEPMRLARIQKGFDDVKEFSRLAGELGFEHQVVEGLWRDWSDEQIEDQVAYAAERHVSLWFWLHSRDQRDAEKRRELFARLHGLGVAGVKEDFCDHEAREVIDLYEDIRRDAAGA